MTFLTAYLTAIALLGVLVCGVARQGTTQTDVSAVYPGGCVVHEHVTRTWHFTTATSYTITCPAGGRS